jgi:putative transposase
LLRREGLLVDWKRVQRVCRRAGLYARRRPRKRVVFECVPKPALTGVSQRWSDDTKRECLVVEVERSLQAKRLIAALDRVARSRGYAPTIVCDNGPEFRSAALDQSAY